MKMFGSSMLRMGAKRGDVFNMVVPNIPEFPIAFLGAVGVGITITTTNPTYRARNIVEFAAVLHFFQKVQNIPPNKLQYLPLLFKK